MQLVAAIRVGDYLQRSPKALDRLTQRLFGVCVAGKEHAATRDDALLEQLLKQEAPLQLTATGGFAREELHPKLWTGARAGNANVLADAVNALTKGFAVGNAEGNGLVAPAHSV